MLSIGRISAGDAAGYYLERQAGCDLDYYTGEGEAVGRWLGDGAAALGLTGALDEAGEQALRALLSGCGLGGERLAGPVLRCDPRGLLLAEPLVRALQAVAARRGGADLVGDGKLADTIDAATARVEAGEAPTIAADVVGQAAEAAGVDPVALYRTVDGVDTYRAALPHAGAKVDVRRPGLDVTVSAPKSVSLLFGLGDPAVAHAVRSAHDIAVAEVVTYLQRHAATGARGHQGRGRIAPRIGTDGLIVAAFDHRTSRAGDPQLHTHLVIPNVVRGADGRWSAMDTAAVYRHARTASSLYHAVLRGELTRTLGVGWTPVVRGIADIDGIPRSLIDRFSKRRAVILDALSGRGASGPKAAQAACLATRPAKTHEQPRALRARWHAEALDAGVDPQRVAAVLGTTGVPGEPAIDRLAADLFGPRGVTAEKTTFTRQDLARGICETLPVGTPVALADVDRLVQALITRPEVLPVLDAEARERRYTTRELVATEQHALRLADASPARPVGTATMRSVPRLLDRTDLSTEQKTMVHTLVTSGRRVDVVTGPAGCGKTAALALAHRLWAHAQHPVHGATVSWLAAQHLEAATGIPTESLARTIRRADGHGLPPGVVLVVDEAGMVNTRLLARLLEHVCTAGGKLVLIGDHHQLPEIGAGGLFSALAERGETIRLTGNQRQVAAWERDALTELRDGDVVSALDTYLDHGRVHTEPTDADVRTRIARDYLDARERGDDVLVLAARRRDVAALNTTIRGHLADAGVLGADELHITTAETPIALRTGEQVLILANDRRLGLTNGTRATVTALNQTTTSVRLRFTDGRQITLDRDHLTAGALTHGYAVTVHKAQGLTVDTTLIYGTGPLTHEHGYVALSRGRHANHIYLAPQPDDGPECGPWPRPGNPDTHELTTELLERLADRRSHLLASQQLASATELDRQRRWLTGQDPAPTRTHGLGR